MTADGAERREIMGRRPLGDMRPIPEADVWLNMGRYLARQPEQESALGFLARAHEVRREATAALQVGLQPGEQWAAEGLAPTSLAQGREQLRLRGGVRMVAERLAGWAEEQQNVVEKLAGIAPAAQEIVAQMVERLRPVFQQAAERTRKPAKGAARRHTTQVEIVREDPPIVRSRTGPSMGL